MKSLSQSKMSHKKMAPCIYITWDMAGYHIDFHKRIRPTTLFALIFLGTLKVWRSLHVSPIFFLSFFFGLKGWRWKTLLNPNSIAPWLFFFFLHLLVDFWASVFVRLFLMVWINVVSVTLSFPFLSSAYLTDSLLSPFPSLWFCFCVYSMLSFDCFQPKFLNSRSGFVISHLAIFVYACASSL